MLIKQLEQTMLLHNKVSINPNYYHYHYSPLGLKYDVPEAQVN